MASEQWERKKSVVSEEISANIIIDKFKKICSSYIFSQITLKMCKISKKNASGQKVREQNGK